MSAQPSSQNQSKQEYIPHSPKTIILTSSLPGNYTSCIQNPRHKRSIHTRDPIHGSCSICTLNARNRNIILDGNRPPFQLCTLGICRLDSSFPCPSSMIGCFCSRGAVDVCPWVESCVNDRIVVWDGENFFGAVV